jgi:radical SAM superfamily enzyme YgiQ (UPF0313 family)
MNVWVLNPPTREGRGFIREGRCNQESGVWTTLWPPLSLANIAAALESRGHTVRGLDAAAIGYPRASLLEDLARERPPVVLWSTGTPSIYDDLALAAEIKAVTPSTLTAVFGNHVTALDRRCLEENRGLDAVIRREPEATAAEWVDVVARGAAWDSVAGLTWRAGGDVVRGPERPFIEDLDAMPDPAWHLFDIDRYRLPLKGTRFLMVAPHRGCPYPCSFCTAQTYYGSRLRRRSPARVVAEIEGNRSRHGVREFFFWADTFTLNRSYVVELCQALEPLGVSWAANSRVDTMDPALAQLMRRAGCWMVSFGIEAGDEKVLDLMGKGATVGEAASAVAAAGEAGLKVAGHFVLGLPGETRESMEKTLALANRLPLDFVQFYCAVPLPGSRLYDSARQENWLATEDFTRFRQDQAILELPGLSAADVMRYRRKAYRRFYLNPRVLWGAFGLLSPRHLGTVVAGARRFLGWSQRRLSAS